MTLLALSSVASGVARSAHQVVPTNGLVPESALLMEPARTNRCTRSEEFNDAGWVKVNATVTANAITAPDGTLTADLLTATGASRSVYRVIPYTIDGTVSCAVFLKRGTASVVQVGLWNQTATAVLHYVNVTWTTTGATVATSAGSGTVFPPDILADGWIRVMLNAPGVFAGNVTWLVISPDAVTTTGNVYAWGAQAEDAAVPSAYIPTVASVVARAADVLTYPSSEWFTPRTFYARSIERGASVSGACILFGQLTNVGQPSAYIVANSSGYSMEYTNGVSFATATVQPSAVFGDVIEVRGILTATGATQVGVTKNRGTETLSAVSSPVTVFLGQSSAIHLGGPTINNPVALTHVALAEGEQSLDTMRQLAGVP